MDKNNIKLLLCSPKAGKKCTQLVNEHSILKLVHLDGDNQCKELTLTTVKRKVKVKSVVRAKWPIRPELIPVSVT